MVRFGLHPDSGAPDELADALTRLAWYGAPAFDAGAKLCVPAGGEVEATLARPAPSWASDAAAMRFDELPRHVDRSGSGSSTFAVRWRAGQAGYDLPPVPSLSQAFLRADERADPAACQAWIDFSAAFSPAPVRLEAPPLSRPGTVLLTGAGPSRTQRPEPREAIWVAVLSSLMELQDEPGRLPDLVISTDALSLVGPSQAAAIMRERLSILLRHGVRAIVREDIAGLLSWQLDEDLWGSVFAIPAHADVHPGTPLDESSWAMAASGNVLTDLGLPLAASLSKDIFLAGFDGATDVGEGFEHGSRQRAAQRFLNLRHAHPLSGLAHDYHGNLVETVRDIRAALGARGVTSRAAGEDTGTRSASPAAAGPVAAAKLPRGHWIYSALLAGERNPLFVAVAAAAAGLAASFAAVSIGDAMTDYILAAGLSLLFAGLVFVYFHLRQRQSRMAAELRRSLSAQLQEALAFSDQLRRDKSDPQARDDAAR